MTKKHVVFQFDERSLITREEAERRGYDTAGFDLDVIRAELDRRAAGIDAKIARLEAAQKVSRETMELEFTI